MSVAYVPAGYEHMVRGHLTMYSRVEPHEKETSTFVGVGRRIWETKSRKTEQNSSTHSVSLLPDEQYDVCTPVMSGAFLKLNGINMCLVNPHGRFSGKSQKNLISTLRDLGLQVICDSGGFQLFSGTTDFVDPVHVAKSYNRCATLGMDLDIPTRPGLPFNFLDAMAKAQMANREVMESIINNKVHLVTVVHGLSYDLVDRWTDLIGRFDSPFVSIAGFARMPPNPQVPAELRIIENLCMLLSKYKKITYLHCLGATSPVNFFTYSLFDHLGLVKNIGGDSVGFLVQGASGTSSNLFPWKQSQLPKEFHIEVQPACSCPFCVTAKDLRVVNSWAFKAHCLYNKNQHKNYIVHLTRLLLDGEIKIPEFLQLTNLPLDKILIERCINYVQEFKASGRKFKPISRTKRALFNTHKTGVNKEQLDNIEDIIRRYEKYHEKRFL